MIKKTFLIFICLLGAYAWLAYSIKWKSKSLTQWEHNERLISNFIYSTPKANYNTIIVGTSLSFRMTTEQNPYADSVYNLALGGQSLFDGLEVLKQTGYFPKTILIETNVLSRLHRKNYAQSFFIPGVHHIKSCVLGFRYEYRPITFSQYFYYGLKNKILNN